MRRFWSVLEYLTGALMIVGGVNSAFQEAGHAQDNIFTIIFDTQTALVIFGLYAFALGAVLIWGKYKNKSDTRAVCLMQIYLLMVFATIADIVFVGLSSFAWLDSVIIGLTAALLHVRVKVGQKIEKHLNENQQEEESSDRQ